MASPQSSQHLLSQLKITAYDFDYAADPVDVAWVDMQNFRNFAVLVFRSVGSNTVDGFSLLANSGSSGGGTDITVKTHALGSAPNAVGDYIFLECTAEEIAQEAADAGITGARYVSANLELNNAGEECVVVYILGGARFEFLNQTADYIS